MANKKIPVEVLGESHLPADLLTPTLGSNYGLDGYPDMAYGMGVLEGVLDPQYTEAPALPTGIHRGAAEEMDLEELLKESSLADLSWLDPSQLQDPERLPKNPVALSIPELEDAWGVDRRTTGIALSAHQKDLDAARYEESLDKPRASRRATREQILSVVQHAMRRSAAGHDIDRVVREAMESFGEEMDRLPPLLHEVREEHGLAGNVFLRAAAYPGWAQGRWSKMRQAASRARYLIVSEEELRTATWIQNGRCSYTGKISVTEVPWQEALEHYLPLLESTGRRVGSGSPREKLRAAFLSQPQKREVNTVLPEHVAPADRISLEEARQAAKAHQPQRKVYDPTSARAARLAAKVDEKIRKMAALGQLSIHDRDRLLESSADPHDRLKEASGLAALSRSEHYYGDSRTVGATADFKEASRARLLERQERDFEASKKARALQRAEKVRTLVAKVEREIERGGRGEYLRKFVARTIPEEYAQEAVRLLAPTFRKTGALEDQPREVREYEGPKFNRNASTARGRSVLAGQVKHAAAWVRRTLNEGFAGKNLDALIQNRFASALLDAARGEILQVREAHEGLSGFLYVDAEAYASESGVKGCDEGALKHRANKIPLVREMPRCGECTLAKQLEDGTRRCSVYRKALVPPEDLRGEEISHIREKNLRAADMTDAEATASYFAPAYDPGEFGLENTTLEEIEAHIPETEKVAEIMFGGWDL
jgi:hypothetical protein